MFEKVLNAAKVKFDKPMSLRTILMIGQCTSSTDSLTELIDKIALYLVSPKDHADELAEWNRVILRHERENMFVRRRAPLSLGQIVKLISPAMHKTKESQST